MRILIALMLGTALMMTGCSDDNAGCVGGDCGGNGGDGGGGAGGDGGVGGDGGGGAGGGGAELAAVVRWEPAGACTQGEAGAYDITVEALNSVGDVTVMGSVTGCTGDIDNLGTSQLTCPNARPYDGIVQIEDDNGTDTVEFSLGVCETGSSLER
jgi:hypothetical protein